VREVPVAGASSSVVVCAHYDSHGRTGRGTYRGADDNGSGVACVLEAVSGIEAEMAGAKRSLVVVLTDGEEWGLQGARAFLAARGTKGLSAVVNVDSVGRAKDGAVHVVGLSREAALAAKAVEALSAQGLRAGADIDRFAYDHGSDHWPFHRAGVPAVTLWATDYATMDTLDDTPEKVDPVAVARVSKALRALLLRLLRE
jgi:Zn-dependent M28 family amino/carboxypeptidase